jgi:hypothetical protein
MFTNLCSLSLTLSIGPMLFDHFPVLHLKYSTQKHWTRLKLLASDKHTSFLIVLAMEQLTLKKCKQRFKNQHLLLFRDIWCSKFLSIFKCSSFFQHQCYWTSMAAKDRCFPALFLIRPVLLPMHFLTF